MESLLKFITCGSVDDGKSTLIGHMLYDAKLLFADQEKALELDSKVGSRGGEIDYSLLLDGLMAEREQGITIDVAYRYFTTDARSFIVADTPGHEQYTRNMAVGASFADLAVILVDATKGVITQTKRHARICYLMGIRHMVLAVNKMDLIKYDEETFRKINRDFDTFISSFADINTTVIPVSATEGDNITSNSTNTRWYNGPPLLTYLENADVTKEEEEAPFIMPVQRVSRPGYHFRGFQGQIESGRIHLGDEVLILPSRERAIVKNILITDQEVGRGDTGQPVTVQLDRELDISRGNVITDVDLPVTDRFTSSLLWMDDEPLTEGKNFLVKAGTKTIPGTVTAIHHKTDINTGDQVDVSRGEKNELLTVEVVTAEKGVFDSFRNNETLGAFILIDRVTNSTAASGVIEETMHNSPNTTWEDTSITREFRAGQKGQKPVTLWFTGLSGSGKSTLASEIEARLFHEGYHTMLLDGDNVRHGLNGDLGFNAEDRFENIRRIAEVSRLMNDAGLITLTSFISPYQTDREKAKRIIGEGFIEIFVNTPLEVCEERDVKGLYKKARKGKISGFTGVSAPYEAPGDPDIQVDTTDLTIEEATDYVLKKIKNYLVQP
ncbi:sulfate adenylyltransferase [Jeotgalibacillus malaysiensis]|uniref:Adenylyl-sulfate kinase n=1 Tax=Jeotgalibacillus malaysiensis TaxID=1508404 RepID=A0A0B5AUU1_9BACL|nr:adenylyl-sulfate kinase [Jeotgalibacillus malaysiensis]AJD91789.1 sulfate adenylyltransferase [Jeotgalibacillus malaysiensis]